MKIENKIKNNKVPSMTFFTTGVNSFVKIFSTTTLVLFFLFSFAKITYADPVFTVNNSIVSQVTFSGTGLDGVGGVRINLTRTSTGGVQTFTDAVVNNSFSGLQASVTPGEAYTYTIINTDNEATLKTGGFTAFSPNPNPTPSPNPNPTPSPNPNPTPSPNPNPTPNPNPNPTPNPSTGAGEPITLENPLKGVNTLPELAAAILKIIVTIGSWILALFIIYVGFKFVAARGDPKKLEEAKQAFVYTLIGGAILLGAFVIAEAIVGTIEALK